MIIWIVHGCFLGSMTDDDQDKELVQYVITAFTYASSVIRTERPTEVSIEEVFREAYVAYQRYIQYLPIS